MRMIGKLIKGTVTLEEKVYEISDSTGTYQERLERCLLEICSSLNIEVPIWLNKNTREYVKFRRTSFYKDQFFNPVFFERFEIKVEN
ncbi:MAG: hypothetical protein GX957_01975 [Clostridiaceae bacterium]|nr:hypothetical protein [Clostridiaceae bacterium]